MSDSEQEGRRTVADSICSRVHRERKRDAAMPWRNDDEGTILAAAASPAGIDPDLRPITDRELRSVSLHPEDVKYYPGQFRRWRFDFGGDGADEGSAAAQRRASMTSCDADKAWIPFYRLRGRQRLVVEMKLAPQISVIVRSRWPQSTVRDFTPAGKFPLV